MSNPIINRWGLNLFWYRFWFTDKNNSLNVNQDNLINKLIILYVHYGLLYPTNSYLSKYWFFFKKFNFNFSNNLLNLKYFRLVEYKNKIINETKNYKLRNKLKNLYFSKIWILKYQSWLVINFYCFQPLISKHKKKKYRGNLSLYLDKNSSKKNLFLFLRFKLYLFYFTNNFLNNRSYETF